MSYEGKGNRLNRPIPPEIRDKVIEEYILGEKIDAISAKYNVSRHYPRDIMHKMGLSLSVRKMGRPIHTESYEKKEKDRLAKIAVLRMDISKKQQHLDKLLMMGPTNDEDT